jgi:ABC-type transport system involved in multi-copper enzyme maturation permease subunit
MSHPDGLRSAAPRCAQLARGLFCIWAIATNTVRESVRSKLLYGLLFFAVLLIGAGAIVARLSYVEGERILQDIGMGSVRLFGVAIAILVGINLIHREVDRRTVYTILSKPLSRGEFLVGKFLGLTLTIWLQMAIMGVAFVAVSLATGAPLGASHLVFFALAGVELALVVAIATLFSAFTTPVLATFFTAGAWMVGHQSRQLRDLGAGTESQAIEWATWLLHRVLPDLESFNLSSEAAHLLPVSASDWLLPTLYGAGYLALVLFAAVAVFERRDLR